MSVQTRRELPEAPSLGLALQHLEPVYLLGEKIDGASHIAQQMNAHNPIFEDLINGYLSEKFPALHRGNAAIKEIGTTNPAIERSCLEAHRFFGMGCDTVTLALTQCPTLHPALSWLDTTSLERKAFEAVQKADDTNVRLAEREWLTKHYPALVLAFGKLESVLPRLVTYASSYDQRVRAFKVGSYATIFSLGEQLEAQAAS